MKNLFSPKSIAIIGASENEKKVGGILLRKLSNFKGKVIPVNPNYIKIMNLPCYGSILDYPNKIDLAIIAIPADLVADALEECGIKSVKNVIIISAGFSESGNFSDERKIKKIAKKYNMRLLGPNCFGIFNPSLNLDCTFSKTTPRKGSIAFISQSGALWSYISDYSDNKFGFSGFVSLGNMVDLDFYDFIDYFSKDKNTKSIVLYIEKLKDGKKFIESCIKSKKKIYAVKAGKSEKGKEAAFSHTGSLATDYAVYRGVFKQANVKQCNSLLEAFEKASGKKISLRKKPVKMRKRAFIITNAGGAGALISDMLSEKGFDIVSKKLKNPLDLLGTADSEKYRAALNSLASESFYDFIIVIVSPQHMTDIENISRAIIEFKKASNKKVIACILGESSVREASIMLKKNNVPCFNTLEELGLSLSLVS